MTRYFFHLSNDAHPPGEDEGVVLPDRNAAWNEAVRTCGELLMDIDGSLTVGTHWRMEVSDEEGLIFVIDISAQQVR